MRNERNYKLSVIYAWGILMRFRIVIFLLFFCCCFSQVMWVSGLYFFRSSKLEIESRDFKQRFQIANMHLSQVV